MKTTNESSIDSSKMYFHGSSEPKVSKLDAPSFEHPFYVTPDLHYAMAFCTKTQSLTGEYGYEKTFTPASQNYVYVVSLSPSCKVFDFRNHHSSEFKKIYSIIDEDLIRWMKSNNSNFDLNDIYEFIAALETYVIKPVDDSSSSYLKYSELYSNAQKIMSPRIFLKACQFVKKNGLRGASKDLDIHQIMVPVLKGLSKMGFQGILTKEVDFNNEPEGASAKVSTCYAIGIFDKSGLDLLSIVPMKYEWLKKINPSYLQDTTDESAYDKIKHYIDVYKRHAQAMVNEGKAEYLKKFSNEPDVDSIVDKFWEIRHRTSAPQNDIDWWIKKPYSDLKHFVLGFDTRNKKERRDFNYRVEAMNDGAKLLGNKDGYEIWYVPTYEAMRTLGRFYKGVSTEWCVASDDPSFWFDIHDNSEFIVLVRENMQHDEFDKVAIEMQNGGNVFDVDDFIMWDVENEDDRFCNDDLMHYAWQLFKSNSERRQKYY